MSGAEHVPIAVATRAGAVESVHYGSVAVVDAAGTLLYAAGDPDFLTFTRSALKPLQALPTLAEGAPARFGFSAPEIALMCASHSGEPVHVQTAGRMLAAIGCTPNDLQCGVHAPLYYSAHDRPVPPASQFTTLHHNCSGKHAGMLAYCRLCGLPSGDYLSHAHPVQEHIREVVAEFAGTPADRLVVGIDGCSAPNYAVPLAQLACAFARLVAPRPGSAYAVAARAVVDAMTSHPDLVSGSRRNDLALTQAGRGDWVSKIGAEGVQAIGVRSRGWGIAIKVADGAARALHPATVEVLDQLGLLDDSSRSELAGWRFPEIRNHRGTVTGGLAPAIVVERT